MKVNKFLLFFSASLFIFISAGCAPTTGSVSKVSANQVDELPYNMRVNQVYDAMQTGQVMVIDVRELNEYEEGHIPGVTLIPMSEITNRLSEIPQDQQVIVTCRSGNRSSQVAEYLTNQGYTNVHNMTGGFLDWESAGLPIEK
jgi:rhodanese-related sulfurtransferase